MKKVESVYLDGVVLERVFIQDDLFHFEFANGIELAGVLTHVYLPQHIREESDPQDYDL